MPGVKSHRAVLPSPLPRQKGDGEGQTALLRALTKTLLSPGAGGTLGFVSSGNLLLSAPLNWAGCTARGVQDAESVVQKPTGLLG